MPIASWGASYLRECDADNNLYYSPGNETWATEYLAGKRAEGVETHSLQADPELHDIQNGSCKPSPESPALGIGFKPFSVSRAGSPPF